MKGKMRSLLAKEFNERVVSPDDDDIRLTRLFGSAKKGSVKPSRIQISDMIMVNDQELREKGLQSMTEVKFENSINRATAVATPRQIERVVRGSIFELDIIYEVENIEELLEDMETIGEGMKLLQYDYLGGSGSRGYGKVGFSHLYADVVIGDIEESVMEKCNEILQNAVEN